MNHVYLLDCTLRDGGYVNDWRFGRKAIEDLKEGLEDAGIDIIELGFFRKGPSDPDRSVYSSGRDIHRVMARKKAGVLYSAMLDGADLDRLYPVERLESPEVSGIDYIRVCTWKRLMKEHLRYCQKIAGGGYRVSIQPTAVEQYNDDEFVELLKYANDVQPYAVYVVDTWGTRSPFQIARYFELADRYLDPSVKIGYHGHNNQMQALSCAETVLEMQLEHDVCLDASIMGMGRGIGNLPTEIIMEDLNERRGKSYDTLKVVELYLKYLKAFNESTPWEYTMYHFLSSLYSCPQDFATYFRQSNIEESVFLKFLEELTPHEKIVFNKKLVDDKLDEMRKAGII